MTCSGPIPRAETNVRRAPWWMPSVSDLFFAALLYAAFGRRGGWQSLLTDADCGWHIRTGEYILTTGSVPWTDLFSFSRPGSPWFAWEWLSDVLFAWLYRAAGLSAVVAFSGLVIGIAVLLLWCWLLRQGVGLFVALPVTLLAASASTVHYLARPHIFTILLFTVSLWLLIGDRRHPGARVWWLVPITALWANLHGGFLAWPVTLAVAAFIDACSRDWSKARRYGGLTLACAAATLLNPYGPRVHAHIVQYLGSAWISNSIQEFQSPQFRSENVMIYGLLLIAGLLLAPSAWRNGERFQAVLVCLWACASLRSARHIPLYSIVAAPVIAGCWSAAWRRLAHRSAPRSLAATAWQASLEYGSALGRPTPWLAALAAGVFAATLSPKDVSDFPSQRFPAEMVKLHSKELKTSGRTPRILTTDQWADYLIFRLYPDVRVFFDGRSDFYGPEVGNQYRALMQLTGDWREQLRRHDFDVALLPLDWPLREILETDRAWRKAGADKLAVLFVRNPGAPVLSGGEAARGANLVGEGGTQ
ncbi:MAG: hypothetical protein IT161_20055 [Bryobacterales bacterium]|nr:hypothetical protein [Bryobacterales bacterium]